MQQLSKVLNGENGHHFTGEFIGTAIFVFFGCGSVATSILFNVHFSLSAITVYNIKLAPISGGLDDERPPYPYH